MSKIENGVTAIRLGASDSFERDFPGVQAPLNDVIADLLKRGVAPLPIGAALIVAGMELLVQASGPGAALDAAHGIGGALKAAYPRESALHAFNRPVDNPKGAA